MSKKASPIPIQTIPLTGNSFSIPWTKWFKDIGDDWVSDNRVLTISNFNYCVQGCICFFSYNSNITNTIKLPYSVGVDSVINGVVVEKGTKEIELSSPISGFYFIQF